MPFWTRNTTSRPPKSLKVRPRDENHRQLIQKQLLDAYANNQINQAQYEKLRARAQRATFQEIMALSDRLTSRVDLLLSLAGLASISLPFLSQIPSQNNDNDDAEQQNEENVNEPEERQNDVENADYDDDEFGVEDFEAHDNTQYNHDEDMTHDHYDDHDDDCVDC